MKKTFLIFCLVTTLSVVSLVQTQVRNEKLSDDQMTGLVLHTFANIVGNFVNIVADPHNPDVVGPSVGNILTGIVNVATEALRKKNISQKDIDIFVKHIVHNTQKRLTNITD